MVASPSRLLVLLALSSLGLACGKGKAEEEDRDGDRVPASEDCDDDNNLVHPGATELCDGIDNNCDGQIDENAVGGTTWYVDADGDGHGATTQTRFSCLQPPGFVLSADDCDDTNAARSPSAEEACDELDNDCDGAVDEGVLRGLYRDRDGDGYGVDTDTMEGCVESEGWSFLGGDCDDEDAALNPGQPERCNDLDDDCNGVVDDNAIDASSLAVDADGDGFGQPGTSATTCDGASNEADCDDSDPTEPVAADPVHGSAYGTGSYFAPFLSLQDAIDASSRCVVAMPGTYAEAIDFRGKDIEVRSVAGPAETTIDATGLSSAVVSFAGGETEAALLSGFTLTGGMGDLESVSSSTSCSSTAICTDYYQTWCGGGLYVDASDPTLEDLVVSGNTTPALSYLASGNDEYFTYSYGGGGCFLDSLSELRDVWFLDNFADQGGGIYVDDTSLLQLQRVVVAGSTATDGAGVFLDGGGMVASNLILSTNTASEDGGGLLMLESVASISNATVTMNRAAGGAGIWLLGNSSARIVNSIIAGNNGDGVRGSASAGLLFEYNNVQGNTSNYTGVTSRSGSSGNIELDPMFVLVSNDGDESNDDLRLQSGSPSVDAGNPDAAYNDVDGTRNDMGAYGGPAGSW